MTLSKLFSKPGVIAIVGDVNQGKTMLLFHIIEEIKQNYSFKLFQYGLTSNLKGATRVNSVAEIETIRDSVIIIDEMPSLFDLDNRKIKTQIENSLRLINHNNNVVVLSSTPEGFKKFLSAKVDAALFKRCTIADFINGSRMKNIVLNYRGKEKGSEVLNLNKDEALLYDGSHYSKVMVPYYPTYDSKAKNVPILVRNNVQEKVQVSARTYR